MGLREPADQVTISQRSHLHAVGDTDERTLFARVAASGDARARELLVQRYLPLARSVARRYQRSQEPFEDLLQVASIGLINAIDRYDADREIAFSSFAVPTILGEVKRHFRDRTWAVRVPRDLKELSLRVDKVVGQLTETLHCQPTVAQVAAALGVQEEEVLEAMQAGGAHRAVSFDMPAGRDDDAATIADLIGVDERGFEGAEQRATLKTLLAAIPARERDVLRLRFERDMTQAEIGAELGMSQMQVSRIIRHAIVRLRDAATEVSAA